MSCSQILRHCGGLSLGREATDEDRNATFTVDNSLLPVGIRGDFQKQGEEVGERNRAAERRGEGYQERESSLCAELPSGACGSFYILHQIGWVRGQEASFHYPASTKYAPCLVTGCFPHASTPIANTRPPFDVCMLQRRWSLLRREKKLYHAIRLVAAAAPIRHAHETNTEPKKKRSTILPLLFHGSQSEKMCLPSLASLMLLATGASLSPQYIGRDAKFHNPPLELTRRG